MKKCGLKWVYFFVFFVLFISINIKCKHVNFTLIKNNNFPTYKGAIYGGNEFRLWMKNSENRENCKINEKKKGQEILRRKPTLMYLIKKGTKNRKFIKNIEKKVTKIILFTTNSNEKDENIYDIINKKGYPNGPNNEENFTFIMGKDQEKVENKMEGENYNSLYNNNNNINKDDDVTYKYVEEMESKKVNIKGVEINYKVYNLEEGDRKSVV